MIPQQIVLISMGHEQYYFRQSSLSCDFIDQLAMVTVFRGFVNN